MICLHLTILVQHILELVPLHIELKGMLMLHSLYYFGLFFEFFDFPHQILLHLSLLRPALLLQTVTFRFKSRQLLPQHLVFMLVEVHAAALVGLVDVLLFQGCLQFLYLLFTIFDRFVLLLHCFFVSFLREKCLLETANVVAIFSFLKKWG